MPIFEDEKIEDLGIFKYSGRKWKAHEDWQWYVLQLIDQIGDTFGYSFPMNPLKSADFRHEIELAMEDVFLIGQLLSEFQTKMKWEDLALRGESQMRTLQDAAAGRVKGDVSERISEVTRLLKAGHSKDRAYELAAKKLGVSARQIRRNWTAHKR